MNRSASFARLPILTATGTTISGMRNTIAKLSADSAASLIATRFSATFRPRRKRSSLPAKATVHRVFADAAPFLPLGRFHKPSPVLALRDVFSKGELIKTDWSGEDHNGERHLD